MKPADQCTTIEEVREAIDQLDKEILETLGRRFEYVKAVTRFKKNKAAVRAPKRFNEVIQQRRAKAEEVGLDPDIIEQMYRLLIEHFIEVEKEMLDD